MLQTASVIKFYRQLSEERMTDRDYRDVL